ncbi:ACR3 family arsenite efflux pump ArsB [Desulfitispora alkaliphila]|uniref:arsenic resistance protein n=1 Tax=Desulfitispora alkaliphila TaxID=622674 RepID=UPI003D1B0B04
MSEDEELSKLEKLQSLFIAIAIAIGLLLSSFELVAKHAGSLIVPALVIMLFLIFLQLPLKNLKAGFTNGKVAMLSIAINFIVTPVLAYLLGSLFLQQYPQLWVGFFMLMITPCTDWYLVFISLSKGDVGLGLSLLPWNLLLQLLLLPAYLAFFAGTIIEIDGSLLLWSIITVLLLPLVVAFLIRIVAIKTKGEEFFKCRVEPMGNYQFIFLLIAIGAMFASQGAELLSNLKHMLTLLMPIGAFFVIIYVLNQLLASRLSFKYGERVTITFTTMARNSPLALAIAVTAFPDQPLIALVLIAGPLIEIPLLYIVSKLLIKRKAAFTKTDY